MNDEIALVLGLQSNLATSHHRALPWLPSLNSPWNTGKEAHIPQVVSKIPITTDVDHYLYISWISWLKMWKYHTFASTNAQDEPRILAPKLLSLTSTLQYYSVISTGQPIVPDPIRTSWGLEVTTRLYSHSRVPKNSDVLDSCLFFYRWENSQRHWLSHLRSQKLGEHRARIRKHILWLSPVPLKQGQLEQEKRRGRGIFDSTRNFPDYCSLYIISMPEKLRGKSTCLWFSQSVGQRATSSSPRTGRNGHSAPLYPHKPSWLTNEQTAVLHHLRVCLGVAWDKKVSMLLANSHFLFLPSMPH